MMTFVPIPASRCKIDVTGIPATIKSMASGHATIIKTLDKRALYDTPKQCPGDKFYFTCSNNVKFVTFDARLGKASAKAPSTKVNIPVYCKIEKRAENGKNEY